MRIIPVILLFLPLAAFAGCFVHPDTGVTYCTDASGCPAGTEWSQSTQACDVPRPGIAAICIGYDSGTYTPTPRPVQNVERVEARRAMWTRVNEIVTVAGGVGVTPARAELTQVYLPLPIPTTLKHHDDLAGTLSGLQGPSSTVVGDPGFSNARLLYNAPNARYTDSLRYVYSYRIVECLP